MRGSPWSRPSRAALQGIRVGDELVLLTWLHEADRSVQQVHPRDDESRPLTGVFASGRRTDRTRSGSIA